jgi:sugar lactone lactonase YvrE
MTSRDPRPRTGVLRWLGLVGAAALLAGCTQGQAPIPSSGSTDVPTPAGASAPFAWRPVDLAFAPDGTMFVTGCADHRIFRVDAAGAVSVFAGVGNAGINNGYSGDGGPAASARFSCPFGLAFDAAGDMFVADHLNDRIRKIDGTGSVTTVVGGGSLDLDTGSSAGAPALDAHLAQPTWLTTDAEGNLYIADRGQDAVRVVDRDGIITTLAGTGTAGDSGDGGPAAKAQIDDPAGIAIDDAGNVYVSDSNNQRIRMIDARGTITTIAGTGHAGYSGDGHAAIHAELSNPGGLAFDAAGNLYVADSDNHVIRVIDGDGLITTAVGTGDAGCPSSGDVATKTRLSDAYSVAVGPHGDLLFTDETCGGIFRVDEHGIVTTFAPI